MLDLIGVLVPIFFILDQNFTRLSALIKLPKETEFFLMRTPEVDSGHNTGHSYAHAHITEIKRQDSIASISLIILAGNFQPRM